MQTERVTFLTTPKTKASLTARATALGISTGEYIRRKVEDDEDLTPEQEAELAALVSELATAVPQMRASLQRSSRLLEESVREVDSMLREAGVRK